MNKSIPTDLVTLRQSFDAFFDVYKKRIKIIIHAGTPKTGSTSLQFYLANQTELLRKHNVVYSTNITDSYAPKHQWMMILLKRCNLHSLLEQFKKCILELDDHCNTLILSTEGIFNHWWDFTTEAKSFFSLLSEYVDLHFWLWVREPVSFMESYYIQALKNPQLDHIPVYGQDLSLLSCLHDPWFIKHIDYLGFIREVQSLHSSISIELFKYKNNSTIKQACKKLGLEYSEVKEIKKNVSISASTIKELRKLNRQKLSIAEKTDAMKLINELDQQNRGGGDAFHCTKEEATQIMDYFEPQRQVLKAEFGVRLRSPTATDWRDC